MTKGTLSNLSEKNLPIGWQFEIELAIHFPVRPLVEMIPMKMPSQEEKVKESLYLSGWNREESRQVWIKCLPSDDHGKKNKYLEITKNEAIFWLMEQRYLNTEEDLEGLIKAYAPSDPIPPFDMNAYRRKEARERGVDYPPTFQ